MLEIGFAEGDRVSAGVVLARIDTADTEIALQRATADRQQVDAQLSLLRAGSRQEDIRQAASQLQSSQADVKAAQAELVAASRRRRALRVAPARQRRLGQTARRRGDADGMWQPHGNERQKIARRPPQTALARLRAGARPQEIEAARARVAAVDAQIASLNKSLADAVVKAPVGGIVTSKLIDPGEMAVPRVPIVVITDLDHAWANVYVDEPLVPQLKIGQPAVLITDAGQRLDGSITFISPKAEFTPRNVQTADERSKLVYRIKITADNRNGVLKPGMPVEAELTRREAPR